MNSIQKLEALLLSCKASINMWERTKFLADFYDTGMLATVVADLKASAAPPLPPEPKCGCGKPAKYLVYDERQPHCLECMMDAIDCDAQVLVHKIC